jgi:signal transduction histidine kinase
MAPDRRDRKECSDELRALHEQLVESEKMASLGQLVTGIAHEINTPLGALKSNNDLFIRSMVKLRELVRVNDISDEEQRAEIEKLFENIEQLNRINKDAADRIIRIVSSLRRFARADLEQAEDVDIHKLIDATLTLVHHEFKNRIEVVREFGDVGMMSCSAGKFNQVIMNILVNAGHAIEGKGRVTIRTRRVEDEIIIEIQDTGVGIPPENLEKIFDATFTTKKSGMGTGLGLAIAREIMEDHGGRIEVDSIPGEGSTFRLVFPTGST